MADAEKFSFFARMTPARQLMKVAIAAAIVVCAPAASYAQFNWPWEEQDEDPPPQPVPREPVYRPPPTDVPPPAQGNPAGPPSPQGAMPGPPPGPPQAGGGAWATKNPICLQLEQRLVQEGQRGNNSRSILPKLEADIRQLDQAVRQTGDQLERRCYEYFLFSKSLRNNPQCRDLARQNDSDKRKLHELETQRQDIIGSGGRSYQEDIISELARNNCGASYQQQARRRESSGPFGFWEDDSEGGAGGGGGLGTYGNLGYATYRTLCVRLCDGYYFPVSFSTLPNHFGRDQEACQSRCAAPVELYYYQNPGGAIDQMVAVNSSEPYTKLNTAFRYRKEYVKGCSCKQAEYVAPGAAGPATPQSRPGQPASPPPQQQGALPPSSPSETGTVAAPAPAPAANAAKPDVAAKSAQPEAPSAPAGAGDDAGWGAEANPQ